MAVAERDSAFLNIPYDRAYEDRFLAYVAILNEIRNALARKDQPTIRQMRNILENIRADVPGVKRKSGARSLFEASAFAELVVVAWRHAELDIPELRKS
jgi:hypothetical protein